MTDADDREAGFATVLVLALALVLGAAALLASTLGVVGVTRHRAAVAADLSALAGAAAAARGQPPCPAAVEVARAQGADLVSCVLAGADVLVIAQVRPPGRLGQLGAARARARAGPGAPATG